MSSLFDLLAAASGGGAGKAFGDEAFLEVIFDEVEAALLASPLRPAAALGGCRADACSHGASRIERVVATSSAACVVACGPACGAPPVLASYDRADVLVDPVLHQTDTGPFLVVADRRSGFAFV